LDLARERRISIAKKLLSKLGKDNVNDAEAETLLQDDDLPTSKDAKVARRTVLEVIVDLKQYPLGYNIMTNIKVDPEFLLQHKQQRDSEQRSSLAKSTSTVKLTGSTSTASINNSINNINSGASTRFIGGFETSGGGLSGLSEAGQLSVESENTPSLRASSEAATSGAGIAAVLGSSAHIARALPSSTSLIRILPPPITVDVIDIPPAPSHSSSLSGGSKRRKHLIIITVPEAETSLAYANAQQQAAQGPKTTSPHVVSGIAAKPVVTTSSASGTTSTMFAPEPTLEQRPSRTKSPVLPSQDGDAGEDTFKPASSPSGTPLTSGLRGKSPLGEPVAMLETRMFQFSVKIDRLDHKDLDHAALQAKKDTLHSTADEKEWSGKVMADGITVKVQTKWSRQELGFMDGMVDEDGKDGEEDEDKSHRRSKRNPRRSGDITDPEHGVDEDDDQSANNDALQQAEQDGIQRRKSISRRKSHHRQQLANLNGQEEVHKEKSQESAAADGLRALAKTSASPTNLRPAGSMSSLSNFLMTVGLMKSSLGSHEDLITANSSPRPNQAEDRFQEQMEEMDQDDDRTIRASKSTGRGGISTLLSNGSGTLSKPRKQRHEGDHDLDLESLHGSIVFKDDDDDDDSDHQASEDQLRESSTLIDSRSHRESSEWTRQSNTLRKRKEKHVLESDEDVALRPSLEDTRSTTAYDRSSGYVSGSKADARLTRRSRRRDSSVSMSNRRQRRTSTAGAGITRVHRPGSTNGADHPRFMGSQLYAYSFRNLFWSAMACFVFGLLLRIYVIGPSFFKTAASTSGTGSTATYYYYYRAAGPQTAGSGSLTRPTALLMEETKDSRQPPSQDQQGSKSSPRRGSDDVEDGVEGSTWPLGIQEVFTIRRLLGWDYVLLAYPSPAQDP